MGPAVHHVTANVIAVLCRTAPDQTPYVNCPVLKYRTALLYSGSDLVAERAGGLIHSMGAGRRPDEISEERIVDSGITRRGSRTVLSALAALGLVAALTMPALAADKATICHATSGSNEFVVITIDEGASAFPHLDDNGSALNGHEDDFLLEGEASVEDCVAAANPTSTPTPSPTPTPTPTPTPSESVAIETATPTPTPSASERGGVEGGNPTPAPSSGELPDTAMGAFGQVPATVLSLVLLGALASMVYVRLARQR